MATTSGIVGEFRSLKAETDADLLAMQCGDFYEFFEDDAEIANDELDLRVSQKSANGSTYPMAGVPVDDVTPYLKALVERGYRVAIADQFETEGGHAREIVRVVTPGTLLETSDTDATHIASVVHVDELQRYGLAIADVTTGRFLVTSIAGRQATEQLLSELYRFQPVEILPGPTVRENEPLVNQIQDRTDAQLTIHDESAFAPGAATHRTREHFGAEALKSLGLDTDDRAEVRAAGAILAYIDETGVDVLRSLSRLQQYHPDDHAVLDAPTQRNLELIESMTGKKTGTLFETIDHTVTSGGARRLKEWLQRPRQSVSILDRRQAAVAALAETALGRAQVADMLAETYDLERLASRITHGSADARTLLQVRDTLAIVPDLVDMLASNEILADSPLVELPETVNLEAVSQVEIELREALTEDPPKRLRDGGIIQVGYHEELDDLIDRHESALEWLASLAEREKQRYNITHLQVDRNRTDGYYIQVGQSEADDVPDEYEQIKALKNSIRFTTPALKDREREILRLEDERGDLEYELFQQLRSHVAERATLLQDVGRLLAKLDALASLATHAVDNHWTCPSLQADGPIDIRGGRHPVVEQTTEFVPNDARLTPDRSVIIVTGPNMSGKSTYMRQVALIVLLAQIGSFVPADDARIGIVDGIYTRVGALDELAEGRSTYMVEMQELSNILHSATADSLVILDEVGRGTATYDGISIAWAATEYLHNEIGATALVATHYHELTVLATHLDRLANVHVAADERDGSITFLRTIREGPTDRSYGVHVADLAGVPRPVVDRARAVLDRLRQEQAIETSGGSAGPQQVVFDVGVGQLRQPEASADSGDRTAVEEPDPHPVLDAIATLTLDEMAPLDLMKQVQTWKEQLSSKEEQP